MPTASERGALPTIPREAMSDVRGTPVVFVADSPTGPFRVRAIRAGAPLGGRIQIESGLSAGELLVINGTVLLKGELLRAELEGD
jgi:multidrug efflux pump subunit AcrA (membrane-fusion protein)